MLAEGDADLLIVQTAIEAASQGATSLIGEDTDLLDLLCFHADANLHPLYFRSKEKQVCKTENRMWHVHDLSAHLAPKLLFTTFCAYLFSVFLLRYHFTIVWYC